MGVPRVVLVDSDEQYAASLEYKFLEEFGSDVSFETITDPAYMDEYFSAPHNIDALIVSEDVFTESMGRQNAEKLFVLTETQNDNGTCSLLADYIFKYSSTSLIFDKLVASCEGLNKSLGEEKETRVILFYSPVGGSGKSTLAISIASYFQSVYKRTLYVDAEYLQNFSALLRSPHNAPSEMLELMMSMADDCFSNVSSFICSDCCDYLPPLRPALISVGIDFDFYARFIEAAKNSGKYDFIIVDTDSVFNEEKIDLLSLANEVVLAVTQSKLSLLKVQHFLDNLDSVERSKYHFVCNQFRADEENAFSVEGKGAGIIVDTFIDYDPTFVGLNGAELSESPMIKKFAYSLM